MKLEIWPYDNLYISSFKIDLIFVKDKSIAEKLIIDLGGEVSTESAFDSSATHLICSKPARNEKVLSSIASGKWVLHYSYIEACNKENRFLNVSLIWSYG